MTDRKLTIDTLAAMIPWAQSLKELDERIWRAPMQEGKWSIAEVMSHLMFWDRIIVRDRLPFIKPGAKLESMGDQQVNSEASNYAFSVIPREQLLEEFIDWRRRFVDFLSGITDEMYRAEFSIGQTNLTMAYYAEEMVHHDVHHKQQIDTFLK